MSDSPVDSNLLPDRSAKAIRELHSYAAFLGTPLLCIDSATCGIAGRSHDGCLNFVPADFSQRAAGRDAPRVWPQSPDHALVSLPLPSFSGRELFAVGCVLCRPGARPHDLVLAAAEQDWSQSQLDDWLCQLPSCDTRTLERLLTAATQRLSQDTQQETRQTQLDDLATEVEYTYEEISLLHALTQNLQISKAPSELAWLALK